MRLGTRARVGGPSIFSYLAKAPLLNGAVRLPQEAGASVVPDRGALAALTIGRPNQRSGAAHLVRPTADSWSGPTRVSFAAPIQARWTSGGRLNGTIGQPERPALAWARITLEITRRSCGPCLFVYRRQLINGPTNTNF